MSYREKRQSEANTKACMRVFSGLQMAMADERFRAEIRKEIDEKREKEAKKPQQLTLFGGKT